MTVLVQPRRHTESLSPHEADPHRRCVLVVLVVARRSRLRQQRPERVPPDAVAVVDGTPVTKAELDALLARAKKTYKAQKRAFPKAGTAEYQSLQTQAVAFLVQRAEYDNRAEDLEAER